jgi:rhomboid protease GluP
MGLTIFVFLLQMASQSILGDDLPALFGMKINSAILNGQIWRLITPVLLHGSVLHIIGNMYGLYIFGPELESTFGRARFLTLYLLSALAGNVLSFLFSPNPSLGSSTAVFGLLGAEAVFLYTNRAILGRSAQRALMNLITVALLNLVIGLAPRIDNWGHVGGLMGGTLFAFLGGPLLRIEGVYPALSLVDGRPPGQAVRAGLVVFVLIASLAAAGIYFRLI